VRRPLWIAGAHGILVGSPWTFAAAGWRWSPRVELRGNRGVSLGHVEGGTRRTASEFGARRPWRMVQIRVWL